MLPGAARRRASTSPRGRGGKAGGLAVLAGVAGLAFKNRDKVTALFGRGKSEHSDGTVVPAPTSAEATTPTMTDTTIDPAPKGPFETPPTSTGDEAA